MADVENRDEWPRDVLNIDDPKLIKELEKYGVDLRLVLDKVLRDNEHLAKAYKKRYQQARFCSFLGAVYADKSVYTEEEKTQKLGKLKAYYNQEYKKTKSEKYSYLSLTTATFYCDLLDKVSSQIEADYPGINLPKETIGKPFSKDEITQGRGGGKSKTKKQKNSKTKKDEVVVQLYNVMDLSKLRFLSAEQLHEYCNTILKKSNNLPEQDKSRLVDLVNRIEYAYSHTKNIQDELQLKQHTDKAFDLFAYRAGMSLSPKTQELYVTFIDDLRDEIKKHHPDQEISDVEISLLYKKNMKRYDPTPPVPPNPPVPPVSPTPPVPPTPTEELHSVYTSDEWKQLIDGSKIGEQMPIFLQMMGNTLHMQEGLEISALKEALGSDFPSDDFEKLDADAKEEKIQELKSNLTPAQLAKFNVRVVEGAQKLAEVLPPHQLVVMCQEIDNKLQNNEQQDNKAELEALAAQKQTFVKAMLQKTSDYVNGDTIVDLTNVADVYDGALEMFEYLNKQTDIQDYSPEQVKQLTKNAKEKIEPAIKEYDEINFLADVKEGDSEKIEESFDKVWNEIKDLDFENEETAEKYGVPLDVLKSVEFEGSDSDKAEKKKIFIDTIKATVARTVALEALGKNNEEYAQILRNQVGNVTNNYVVTLKTTDALSKLPENATEEDRNTAIQQALQATKYTVSDGGMATFEAAAVNNHVSFLNRLASPSKLNNRAAPILNKMYGTIAKIDKTCISRFGVAYTAPRDFSRMMLKNMGSQFTNAALRMGCNYGALAFGVPGVGSKVYALIYAGQATYRLFQARKYEKQLAEERGEKFNEGRYWLSKTPEILMSCAGTAVSFCAGPIAEKGLQAVVRYGMLGAGWMISFAKGIHASRKQGNGWFKSIGKAVTNATASTASAVASGAVIGCVINNFSNMASDFWGEKLTHTPNASEYDASDSSFTKDTVSNPGDYTNMTDEQLNESGIIKDGIDRSEAQDMVAKSDEDLAKDGIVRNMTDETDPNGVKIIDVPASSSYADGVTQNAENIVEYWTSADPAVHSANIEAYSDPNSPLSQWNDTHDFKLDANRVELIIGDCGGQMVGKEVDTLTLHVNGDMNNTNPQDVNGNHQVFGPGWIAEHGEKYGITSDDIAKVAACHNSDGSINLEALKQEGVLATIDKLDAIVSEHNEVLDTECTRSSAHTDGFLHRNADVSEDGKHVHSDTSGKLHTAYADGKDPRVIVKEEAHYERFDQYSQIEQHNYIPTVPLFDRIWAGVKDIPGKLRTIMGTNGKRKEGVDKGSLKLGPTSNQR